MKVLTAPTEEFIKRAKTQVTTDATAGSEVAISVINSEEFAVDDYVVVGIEGSEGAEMCQVTEVTAGTIKVATLALNHKRDEPVTKYRYNQRKFYGATSATESFTELVGSGSPVTIKVTDSQGATLEYVGNEGYTYFKATYYNSTTTDETAIGDSTAVQANETARYTSIYAIRKHAGILGNPYYSDERVEAKRAQAENEINSWIYNKYVLPLAEVPALISYICETLAAGFVDYEEFGSDGNGVKWLGEARGILKSIQNETQKLIGVDGTELASKDTASTVQSYPNDIDSGNGQGQKFSMNQVF